MNKEKENNMKSIHVKMKQELYEALNKDASVSNSNMNKIVVELLENKYLNNSNNNITLEVIKNLIETCNINSINRDNKLLKALLNEDIKETLLKKKNEDINELDKIIKEKQGIIVKKDECKNELDKEINDLKSKLEEYREKVEHNDYLDESERKRKERHKIIFIISITLNIVFIVLTGLLVYLKVEGVI